MTHLGTLLTHHLLSIVVALLELGFASAVLSQRRPTGSAAAWLLIILLVPYLGIPLYLVFGGRKYARRARSKNLLGSGDDGLVAVTSSSRGSGARLLARALSSDGRVDWLDDGTRAYDAFLAEIRAAKKTIRVVTFVVGDDPTGRSLLEALAARAKEGVEVRLLIDDLLRFRAPSRQLEALVLAGGRVERFMPLLHIPFRGRSNLRDHRKIALFDGERAIVGGMNLADEYMGPAPSPTRWRDLSILVTGGAVTTLDRIFRADWEFACEERLSEAPAGGSSADDLASGATPVTVVPSGPDSPTDPIYDAILTAIFRAERRFWIATPYFVPDEPLVRALAVAARRGVDVRVIVPRRSNHGLADLAAAPYLRELADAGASIFLHPKMVHAKAMLCDEVLAVVGSANFDMRSLFLDYEVALFLTGAPEVKRLGAWFEETLAGASSGPPEAGRARAQVEGIARLLSPLI
jgi:cardiolipin synthase